MRARGACSALLLAGGLLLAPAAPARAEEPIETDQRRQGSLDQAFEAVTARVVDSVAEVRSAGGDPLGLGVMVEDGLVLTTLDALHDLHGQDAVVRGRGGSAPARVLARNEAFGVALLRVQGDGARLRPAVMYPADMPEVGRFVIAVGTERAPLAVGVVSAINRRVEKAARPPGVDFFGVLSESQGPARDYVRVIQHDGALTADHRGSALVDSEGRLVGVNLASAYRGSSYAIAASDIRHLLPDMREGRPGPSAPPNGWLGVSIGPLSEVKKAVLGTQGLGAEVHAVIEGSPAEAAGLQVGDVIRAIDNRPIEHAEAVGYTLRGKPPGTKVQVVVFRDGKNVPFTVTLADRPEGR